jgi:tubulin-specific chaperone A
MKISPDEKIVKGTQHNILDLIETNQTQKFIQIQKRINILIVSIGSFNTALRLSVLWTKSATGANAIYNMVASKTSIILNLLQGLLLLVKAAFFFATGQMNLATAAMSRFNLVTKLNPIGLLIGLLASAAAAFLIFKKNSDDAKKAVSDLGNETKVANAIYSEFTKTYAEESLKLKTSIEPLIKILNDQNLSLETRKKAYEQLIKIHPEFKDTVNEEYLATDRLTKVYDNLLVSLKNKMKFQAAQSVYKKAYEEQLRLETKLINLQLKRSEVERKNDEWRKNRKGSAQNIDLRLELNQVNEDIANTQKLLNQSNKNISTVDRVREQQINALKIQQRGFSETSKEYIKIQNQIIFYKSVIYKL